MKYTIKGCLGLVLAFIFRGLTTSIRDKIQRYIKRQKYLKELRAMQKEEQGNCSHAYLLTKYGAYCEICGKIIIANDYFEIKEMK